MAEFSKLVITRKGQALIAKMLAGIATDIDFTKVAASNEAYQVEELEDLDGLNGVMQEADVSRKSLTNKVSVKVETAFSNVELTAGYHMRTLGLYALDPDDGEILYAACVELSGNCYMPPYNGITVSGAYIQLVTTVGNADNVSLEVNPAAIATIGDIQYLQNQINDIQTHISNVVPLVIGETEPEKGAVFWFDTRARRPEIIELQLGGEGDETPVTAEIDGRAHPVTNAAPLGAEEDEIYEIEITD